VQRDPIGIRGGLNAYEYCSSNPLTRIDARGLQQFWVGVGEDVMDVAVVLGGVACAATFLAGGEITPVANLALGAGMLGGVGGAVHLAARHGLIANACEGWVRLYDHIVAYILEPPYRGAGGFEGIP
jgi:hypothetical protein